MLELLVKQKLRNCEECKYLIDLFLYRYFSSFIKCQFLYIFLTVFRTQSILCTRSGLICSLFLKHSCLDSDGTQLLEKRSLSRIQDILILKQTPTRQPPIWNVRKFMPLLDSTNVPSQNCQTWKLIYY